MGPPGSGKSSALLTFLKADIELFVLTTEPNGIDSLLDAVKLHNVPVDKLHYHAVPPAAPGWAGLTSLAKLVNTTSYKGLTDMAGIAKEQTHQLEDLLVSCADFPCDRTGQKYGDVTEWGPDRAFALDSLSGLNILAKQHTVGFKPTLHQGEWGVAMDLEEQIILKLTSDCKCFFVLTAHLDREVDEVQGTTKTMAGALGRKLAPKIPRFFSEVVLTSRTGQTADKLKFGWSNIDTQADLKNRGLVVGAALEPSFVPLVASHKRRLEMAGVSATTSAPTGSA